MLALLKLQDDLLNEAGHYDNWFFVTQARLTKLVMRSVSTVIRARRRLKFMGLLDYRLGRSAGRLATQYRVLLDPFYLCDKLAATVSLNNNTKTMANNKNKKTSTTN